MSQARITRVLVASAALVYLHDRFAPSIYHRIDLWAIDRNRRRWQR